MRDFRIAAVVCRSPVGQVKHNLERTRYWTRRARREKAALVCFPELNLTGYSNREDIAEHAISAYGAEIDELVRLSADQQIALLVGFAEKACDGRIFASHMAITPQGRTGVYRKLHLAPPEADRFSPGKTLPVFHWSGIRFGIQLCYDAHFPELSTRMAEAEADMIFMPHASPRGQALDKHQSWMRHLPARAFDNGLFVVACNQIGNNGNGLVFPGNAVVFSPSGEIIETRLSGDPGMLVADLTADQLHHVRSHRMRYFLPNRRPGVYSQTPTLTNLDE
ncbi:nitrilase-related carbon-nitrogen hydrolase [Desulfosarcina sp.]|uniref:nitrilase-related carbon-nitrogen hydrolase n=1 Tax=Desulfosarcina sp. TaxID=2027861 RepID=UPI0035696A5A